MEMPPVPVVAAVAGAEDKILQVGVGPVDRIYVLVSIEGRVEIAQGGVFRDLTYTFSPGVGMFSNPIGRIDTLYNGFGTQTLAAYRSPDTAGEDPNESVFYPGESLTVTFPSPVRAVGVYFNGINLPGDMLVTQPNDYFITTSNGDTVFNIFNPEFGSSNAFPEFQSLFFVGLVSDTPFTSATFGASPNAVAGFNLDNLISAVDVVPEPATCLVLGGLLATSGLVYRRRKSRAAA
jgi:hypothetical protein